MRIEVVSDDMVKVTLTALDLLRLDMTVEDINPNSGAIHMFLFHIMDNIRRETNFDPFDGQVAVEAHANDNGVVLFISKNKYRPIALSKKIGKGIKVKAKKRETCDMVFAFESFDDLCEAMKSLEPAVLSKSALYETDGIYCLIFTAGRDFVKNCRILAEYSNYRSRCRLKTDYVKEHGKQVAQGESLVSMAEGIAELEKM